MGYQTLAKRVGVRLLPLCFAVSCGTDVPELLQEDSRFVWQADEAVASIEELNLGLEAAFVTAESEKIDACEKVYEKVERRIARELEGDPVSFIEKFWFDLKMLSALLLPINSVERCSSAFQRYRLEYEKLRTAYSQLE